MTTTQIIFLVIVFVSVSLVALVILLQLTPGRIRERLGALQQDTAKAAKTEEAPWVATVTRLTRPIAKLSVPAEGWDQSPLRIRFMNAGYRGKSPVALYFAAKTILAVAAPGLFFLYAGISGLNIRAQTLVMLLLGLAAIGYYFPNIVLARRVEQRQLEIFETFPDATDLMLVCVEAGLSLDAALARVADEIRLKSQALADELHLVTLELRAGESKEMALRNLALRTGVDAVDSLVAMLVQTDRFGTSIGDSLRVYADDLRTKRRLRAEEAAAKIPLKLLFPLVFFIFPTLLLVLLGPAFIQVYRVMLPTLSGQ